MPDLQIGTGLRIDPSAILGYPASRNTPEKLELGPDSHIRSGTVLYVGSRIGARFEAGHNVVIREDCRIGDDVSVWSNSVVDYGCVIGDHVKIHANCYVAQFTEIEDGAFLAPGVTIANDLYPGQTQLRRGHVRTVDRGRGADRRQRDHPSLRPRRSRVPHRSRFGRRP